LGGGNGGRSCFITFGCPLFVRHRAGSGQPPLEILVAELPQQLHLPGFPSEIDPRQLDAIEGIGLDYQVDRHVEKHQAVADCQFPIKGIVADDVAGKTKEPAEAEGVELFVGKAGAARA